MSEQLLVVLDASALLALLHQEPGADRVRRSIQSDKIVMSAINYAEVIAKHLQKGKDFGALRDNLQADYPVRQGIIRSSWTAQA